MPATPKAEMRTRRQDKARADRLDAKARKACVQEVWNRAQARCEACGRNVYPPSEACHPMMVGHVHERLSRSLGGNPSDPANCVLLCVRDHFNGPSGAHRRSERAV